MKYPISFHDYERFFIKNRCDASIAETKVAMSAATQASTQLTVGGVYLIKSLVDILVTDAASQATAESYNLTASGTLLRGNWDEHIILVSNGWLGHKTYDGGAGEFRYRLLEMKPIF